MLKCKKGTDKLKSNRPKKYQNIKLKDQIKNDDALDIFEIINFMFYILPQF